MQQTEHYGLNQWELTDRVLMSDFNADNLKLDAALAGKPNRPEFIGQWPAGKTTCGASALMKGSFDWSQWDYVVVTLQFPEGEGITAEQVSYWAKETQLVPPTPRSSSMLVFFSKHDAARPIEGVFLGKELRFFRLDDLTYQDFGYLGIEAAPSERFIAPLYKVYGGK